MKKIEVLGTGCAKCKKLTRNVEEAVKQIGGSATIEKVESLELIMQYGVMMTPALVVNGKVKVVGKVPSVNDIKKMLR